MKAEITFHERYRADEWAENLREQYGLEAVANGHLVTLSGVGGFRLRDIQYQFYAPNGHELFAVGTTVVSEVSGFWGGEP